MPKQKNEAYVNRMIGAMCARVAGKVNEEFVSVRELAREANKREGLEPVGRDSAISLFQRAMTTSDFPAILSGVAGKFLRESVGLAPRSYELWTDAHPLPNFKTAMIPNLGFPGELPVVREGEEYQELTALDGYEPAQLLTRGGLFKISRQSLVNDDLAVFRRIPAAMGLTAVRTMSRDAYRQLLGTPVLNDGVPVFHEDRKNLLTGALAQNTLGQAIAALRLQTDISGNPLSIEPKYLIVPPTLELTAWTLCNALSLPGQNNAGVGNIFRERYGLTPVVASELEDASLGGSSANWFLSADPKVFPTPFLRLNLESADSVSVEEQVGWTTDAMEFKVRVDFSIASVGWRGMIKSTGVSE